MPTVETFQGLHIQETPCFAKTTHHKPHPARLPQIPGSQPDKSGSKMVSLAPKLISALVGQGDTAAGLAPWAATRFPRARMAGEDHAKPG